MISNCHSTEKLTFQVKFGGGGEPPLSCSNIPLSIKYLIKIFLLLGLVLPILDAVLSVRLK